MDFDLQLGDRDGDEVPDHLDNFIFNHPNLTMEGEDQFVFNAIRDEFLRRYNFELPPSIAANVHRYQYDRYLPVIEDEGKLFPYGGAGHAAGTYLMGNSPADSVVDKHCRSHDHPNLFLLGSGTFPALGTANPTLTIAALALRAGKYIHDELG